MREKGETYTKARLWRYINEIHICLNCGHLREGPRYPGAAQLFLELSKDFSTGSVDIRNTYAFAVDYRDAPCRWLHGALRATTMEKEAGQ